jgi:hypothetical protein
MEQQVLWWGYWVGLGILSSVGLGTGLHTFLLYLGPYIASVTIAAFDLLCVLKNRVNTQLLSGLS